VEAAKLLKFPSYYFNIIQKRFAVLPQLFLLTTAKIFALITSLSEGRAGTAWKPCNNNDLFPPAANG
jgi:hypothetical protein